MASVPENSQKGPEPKMLVTDTFYNGCLDIFPKILDRCSALVIYDSNSFISYNKEFWPNEIENSLGSYKSKYKNHEQKFHNIIDFAKNKNNVNFEFISILISTILDSGRKFPILWLSDGRFNSDKNIVMHWIQNRVSCDRDLITDRELIVGFESSKIIEFSPSPQVLSRCQVRYDGITCKQRANNVISQRQKIHEMIKKWLENPYAQDPPEKQKLVQQQLVLIGHAYKCRQKEKECKSSGQHFQPCTYPQCSTMKNLIVNHHMTSCQAEIGTTCAFLVKLCLWSATSL